MSDLDITSGSTIAALRERIAAARRIVGFTGAGLSTECGVPDFRSPGSPWMVNKPIPFEAFLASPAARREAWRRKFTMDDLYRHASPGRGHRALAALVESGRMSAIITQNIDNLHQASGVESEKLIELHGNGSYATCLDCETRHELTWVRDLFERTDAAPDCPHCGGIVKSATISFGQSMPRRAMERAQAETLACDLFLCVGSSLVVYPAAAFPEMAAANDAALVIINREPTPLDGLADLVIRDDIGSVLTEAIGPMSRR